MTRTLACTTALALVFTATGVMADVTPEEVWESWQALSTSAGQEMTVGGTAKTGDTLEVTGIVVTQTDEMGGSFTANIDKMAFKDNGDGTVAVTMSDTYPLTLAFPDANDGPSSVKLTVTQPGLVVTAAGSATETKYDFKAPTVAVTLDEVKDETGKVLDTKADIVLTEATSSYLVTRSGDQTALDSSFAAKAMALNLSGTDTEGGGTGVVTLSVTDLTGATKGNFLGAEIMANMATALNSGFTTDSSFSFGAFALSADITEASGPVKIAATASGGGMVLAIDKTRINYGSNFADLAISASGPEIPFPEVAMSLKEYAFNLMMPVSKSEAPQDFSFLTKLIDFTVSEDVWGMVDPGAILSREPASLVLDVKGQGFWKQDIMDPAVDLEQIEAPGELSSLDLTQVLVKAAGTEIGATGALTFDNTDLVTFQGVPAPTGAINIDIKGVSALIDNLIKLGIITDDDAMGARMMLGMFTRPGTAPDQVTSVIEFKDGGLFANGQQLQ
jgi:Uncharacterized protein conserved in bacteria (DUF2125)